jgi:beta-glucosidase
MTYKERARILVAKMTLAEKMSQMLYNAPAIERLGVKEYNWWNECLHGIARSGTATVFPQAIGMAASWNPDLLHKVATATSDEARAKYNAYKKFGSTLIYQGLTMWSPNINIFRDPRWGRGHETYGEDPYLTGRMGSAFVQGLQGDDPKYRKVDSTLKHYAVHSGPEALRHEFDARVSQKDLYETYLFAFQYCIEHAHPSAVMGAYNRTNGEPCCASKTLLQKILFGEFGFDGYVVSDCGAICDINRHHHVTQNEAESAALAVNNGCQLNCGDAFKWLKTSVALGLLSEETITAAVERLFTARFRLGQFDDDCVYDQIPYDVVESDNHRALNRKMAQESIVLLKNNGILPLKDEGTIAVIGPNADNEDVLLGNYNGTPSRYSTILRGIQDLAGAKVEYARGCHLYNDDEHIWGEHPLREAILAAERADVVIMVMGLHPYLEGEEGVTPDGRRLGDKEDLELPPSQKKLFEAIVQTGKPIVFVNMSGSCVSLTRQDEVCAAVIQCFYPGAEGGSALAEIIFGKVNSSGKLPLTFYRSIDDLPPFEDYSMVNRTYRYFTGKPLYPFGFGLSYTDFRHSGLTLDKKTVHPGESLTASVMLTNTGACDGQEVAQLYIRKTDASVRVPFRQLINFEKVMLRQGESKTIQLPVKPFDMEIVDEQGHRVLEPGDFELFLSPEQAEPSARFTLIG